MKHVRKIFAFALTLVMALAVALPAFADALTVADAGAQKSITITTPDSAQATDKFTYTVYKVFDATTDGTSANISYQAPAGTKIEATDQLSKFEADQQGNVIYYTRTSTGANYAPNTTATSLSKGMIDAIADYTGKTEIGTVEITGKSASKTVNVGTYGYFYITTTAGTVVTIDSTNPAAAVNDKNTLPTMDKDIASVTSVNGGNHAAGADNESGQSATANIGDTINYTVDIYAKAGAERYVYHDILSAGLTLVTSPEPVVKVGQSVLTKGTDYILTKYANNVTNGNVTNGTEDNITIEFKKSYLDTITGDTTINITYSAILNDKAIIAGEGNKNTGKLEYGRSGNSNYTPDDEPKVYSFRFQVVKDNASKEILTGAEFKLYTDRACTTEIGLVSANDGYRVATAEDKAANGYTAATIEAGSPKITGLGNGTYYLKEINAPQGYNKLNDPVEVTIAGANNDATINGSTYSQGGVEVVNQAGTELPSTGGIGTTIFYVVGGVMVAGAVVFLLTKRRVAGVEE